MIAAQDVRELALALDGVTEDGELSFRVGGGGFLWRYPERVHPKKARVPRDDIFMVLTADLDDKEAYLATEPEIFFTTPHYDGHASVAVRLDAVDRDRMRELIVDAHAARLEVNARRRPRKRASRA